MFTKTELGFFLGMMAYIGALPATASAALRDDPTIMTTMMIFWPLLAVFAMMSIWALLGFRQSQVPNQWERKFGAMALLGTAMMTFPTMADDAYHYSLVLVVAGVILLIATVVVAFKSRSNMRVENGL